MNLPVVPTSSQSVILQAFHHSLLKVRWGEKLSEPQGKMGHNYVLKSFIQFDHFHSTTDENWKHEVRLTYSSDWHVSYCPLDLLVKIKTNFQLSQKSAFNGLLSACEAI